MKTKDQVMLEEAYKQVGRGNSSNNVSLFKDKKGTRITHGDTVIHNKMRYKIVGSKSVLGSGIDKDMVQLEQAEGTVTGEIPKLIWTTPKQVVKCDA